MAIGTRPKTYLAFDLGAESGRAVLARLQSGVLTIDVVRRFPNDPVEYGGSFHWDVARLWFEVRASLAAVEEQELAAIGVDTWGVDYALLGERGELLQNPYHYREPRNISAMEEALRLVPKEDIYAATGIQFMPINTLNQLLAAKRHTPRLLASAERLVMMPDLFHYWLTCITVDPAQSGGVTREAIRLALEAEEIEARPLWKPLHLQPVFADYRVVGGAVAEEIFARGLCLPSGSDLRPVDLERVVSAVLSVPRRQRHAP